MNQLSIPAQRMKSPLLFGSLFTGIGGLDLGLERAGLQCAWQVEINDYATQVLEKQWPDVTRFRDVRTCGAHSLQPVDLLCGGFPCQPHSTAGNRKASQDERDLWPEFFRLICALRPGWVLAENVPGILSSEHGRFFGSILRDLARAGYDAQWRVYCACDFNYPHLRKRVFLLGYPVCRRRQFQLCDVPRTSTEAAGRPLETTMVDSVWSTLAQFEQRVCQPAVCRGPDGISRPVDRLRGIGNAVVPAIAEHIGRCLLAVHCGAQTS